MSFWLLVLECCDESNSDLNFLVAVFVVKLDDRNSLVKVARSNRSVGRVSWLSHCWLNSKLEAASRICLVDRLLFRLVEDGVPVGHECGSVFRV